MKRGSPQLDIVLVPVGLAVMLGYHLWLLLRICRRPETTVIGINAINRRIWVRHIMEVRVHVPRLHGSSRSASIS